jgi:hypothetical protein
MVAVSPICLTACSISGAPEMMKRCEPFRLSDVKELFEQCAMGRNKKAQAAPRSPFEAIVLQNSKIPPQQNSRESEFIASLG